jgi:hypothetical protein
MFLIYGGMGGIDRRIYRRRGSRGDQRPDDPGYERVSTEQGRVSYAASIFLDSSLRSSSHGLMASRNCVFI